MCAKWVLSVAVFFQGHFCCFYLIMAFFVGGGLWSGHAILYLKVQLGTRKYIVIKSKQLNYQNKSWNDASHLLPTELKRTAFAVLDASSKVKVFSIIFTFTFWFDCKLLNHWLYFLCLFLVLTCLCSCQVISGLQPKLYLKQSIFPKTLRMRPRELVSSPHWPMNK